jgi:hypothetical protein
MKDKKIIIRLEKIFTEKYFNMCEKNGYTMSKRIRRLMELDNELNSLNLNSIKELEKIISNL